MIGRTTYKDIQGITIKRKVGSNDESEMMSQFSRSSPILNGNKTLLQRWINVNDVDSTSQQRRMRSGCRGIYQFMTAIHYRSTTARVRYRMIYRSHNKNDGRECKNSSSNFKILLNFGVSIPARFRFYDNGVLFSGYHPTHKHLVARKIVVMPEYNTSLFT